MPYIEVLAITPHATDPTTAYAPGTWLDDAGLDATWLQVYSNAGRLGSPQDALPTPAAPEEAPHGFMWTEPQTEPAA
jgi:hypothetical protein